MTNYTTLPDLSLQQDKAITQPLMTALRDNPIAIAEGATGAPFLSSSWHNYDGAQALSAFYDFAVHGLQTLVATPDFSDGWEYRIIFDAIAHNHVSPTTLRISLYKETDAAYTTEDPFITVNNAALASGYLTLVAPRWSVAWKEFDLLFVGGTTERTMVSMTAQKLTRVRFDWAAGSSFSGGKIYMARRQVAYTR
jgi:hypothetical protein